MIFTIHVSHDIDETCLEIIDYRFYFKHVCFYWNIYFPTLFRV